MTTIDELCAAIESVGLPWAQMSFERGEDVQPPFIVLIPTTGNTSGANDLVWINSAEYDVELYTQRRDYLLEADVAAALESAGCFWTSGGYWHLKDEHLFEAVFTVTVRE